MGPAGYPRQTPVPRRRASWREPPADPDCSTPRESRPHSCRAAPPPRERCRRPGRHAPAAASPNRWRSPRVMRTPMRTRPCAAHTAACAAHRCVPPSCRSSRFQPLSQSCLPMPPPRSVGRDTRRRRRLPHRRHGVQRQAFLGSNANTMRKSHLYGFVNLRGAPALQQLFRIRRVRRPGRPHAFLPPVA